MWQITDNYSWENIRRSFPWIRALEGVPQDPIYHAEGDVATHTRLVLEALQQLEEFKALPEQEQHLLRAAALLHDVEKPSTTLQEADGSISARGHAKKGELRSRSILYLDIPTPFPLREQICKLVRHHGLPLWVFDSPDPRKAVIEASLEVDTRLLALLAQADVLGRRCADQQELLYRIELFGELCREWDCWGQPRTFADEYSRFFYLQREEVAPDYVAYNDTKFEVILMAGLPGSGKEMYVHFHLSNWPLVSPDALRQEMKIKQSDKSGWGRVLQRAKEKAREHMRRQESFVWLAPNTSRQAWQPLIDLFISYGAWVRIIYMEAPYPLLQQQNQQREEPIPPETLVRMLARWEVPGLPEAHSVEYSIRELPDPEEAAEEVPADPSPEAE
jgi:predicted kinase